MGLFQRAHSLRSASGSERSSAAKARGLLARGLQFVQKVIPATEELPDTTAEGRFEPVKAAQDLWTSLDRLDGGLESPGQFFRLLVQTLKLKRAAVLLFDPARLVFAPWAIQGFDQTTNRRLRIAMGANEAVNRLAAGDVLLLHGAGELKDFRQYFSFRESAALQELLLVPFIQENRFMGMLLVAEREGGLEQDNLRVYEQLSGRAAALFYRTRERILEAAKRGLPEKTGTLKERVRAAAQFSRERGIGLIMIRFSIARITQRILKRNPYIDSFRLHEDIFRVVLSLFQSLGSVFQIDQERLLAVIGNMRNGDPDLLLYNLKGTLKRLFHELADEEQIELEEEYRSSGEGVEDALTYLAELV
jgi:hypothetical protein